MMRLSILFTIIALALARCRAPDLPNFLLGPEAATTAVPTLALVSATAQAPGTAVPPAATDIPVITTCSGVLHKPKAQEGITLDIDSGNVRTIFDRNGLLTNVPDEALVYMISGIGDNCIIGAVVAFWTPKELGMEYFHTPYHPFDAIGLKPGGVLVNLGGGRWLAEDGNNGTTIVYALRPRADSTALEKYLAAAGSQPAQLDGERASDGVFEVCWASEAFTNEPLSFGSCE